MIKTVVEVEKITLPVNGREMIFSGEELIAILEHHFNSKEKKTKKIEVAERPTEGKCFEVDPNSIDQNLFKKKRKDPKQEKTRRIILEAFMEVKKNPEKYAKPFKTMIPEKTWSSKTVRGLKDLARIMGDHIADWVEQAMEWAQRIDNGETWETICNELDTANWYRLIIWKDGEAKLVGGSIHGHRNYPASDISEEDDFYYNVIQDAVPSIVL